MNEALSRRRVLGSTGLALGMSLSACSTRLPQPPSREACSPLFGNPFLKPCGDWAPGIEGQRRADLGDGRFLNPVLAGDHPDPTVIKDGDDYYMTHSSFEAVPGLLIWHSRDLVNWQPLDCALQEYIGSVWAPELVKHQGRYYIYLPAKHTGAGPGRHDLWVIHADDIRGPWSRPLALGNARIDPGHAVDEQGRRWLFLSAGYRVPLSDDGLRIVGPEEKVYEGWRYPEDWDVESYSQEGPKLLQHDGWYHMVLAVGGTAGPPTGHMVIAARSRSLHGPWEHAPHNPLLRTRSAAERWWSKGHGTLIPGPRSGDWYLLYHGYEAGFHTLGRQTLLLPMRYDREGWFHAAGDESQALPMPAGGQTLAHGLALSDDFSQPRLGRPWHWLRGGPAQYQRLRWADGALHLRAAGRSPADSAPLGLVAGDPAYEIEVDIELSRESQAGLLLYYSERLYAGVGINAQAMVLHRYGLDQRQLPKPVGMGLSFRLRLRNARHVLTVHSSHDSGRSWQKFPVQMDVSGYHHNVAYGFMSLRPALYATGEGEVRFRRFVYRALA